MEIPSVGFPCLEAFPSLRRRRMSVHTYLFIVAVSVSEFGYAFQAAAKVDILICCRIVT
jgi:hypothetical protein